MAAELFGILLPALLFATAAGSRKQALRLKWVGLRPCGMGVVIGAGLFPLAAAAGALAEKILGYPFHLPPGFFPTDLGGTLLYAFALGVSAPFCEEMLFRGYILGAFERAGWRPRTAILAVAALFTAFHLSPSRFPGVAVLALALTYIAWRSRSIWPSMAAHFGANSTAVVLSIARNSAQMQKPNPLVVALLAIAATAAAIYCLRRIAVEMPALPMREIAPTPVKPSHWWPLVVAGLIVAVCAGGEIAIYRFHKALPTHELPGLLMEAPWPQQIDWNYAIYDRDKQIGEADYHIVGQAQSGTLLFGTANFRGYNGLTGKPMKIFLHASWDRSSLMLRKLHRQRANDRGDSTFEYSDGAPPSKEARLSGGLYGVYELPWRLSAAVMLQAPRARPPVSLDLWYAPLDGVTVKQQLRIQMYPQPVMCPTHSGNVRTIRLDIGATASAWYDVRKPYTLIRYRVSGTDWVLVK
ncbi:membrane hypothetical protein [Candidatus Sulfopaludibacter sp. SbA3]|nr:membrane hypothetical protein [Candidatus Sulfopaludibacter sp. SbA3]